MCCGVLEKHLRVINSAVISFFYMNSHLLYFNTNLHVFFILLLEYFYIFTIYSTTYTPKS